MDDELFFVLLALATIVAVTGFGLTAFVLAFFGKTIALIFSVAYCIVAGAGFLDMLEEL